ncbi:RxLR-like protein [Plasmopara halstedii]|uniref:RxLR-like protein n=1 Tax=Plasmopara halstedii TaxID=4781 RepID=A0A0P1AYM6_PLAHL|nr:RxLR-like protein [Plasmopara halstedii]CEG46645.1 RxLR-like protein [Plasmopara halstedii]|eukprot:XP_024583014.1 RxLR-like protein [Plasmopara halstedii]
MKLYQSLLTTALLLSRIEASYTIDNEQEKTVSDAPTARNLEATHLTIKWIKNVLKKFLVRESTKIQADLKLYEGFEQSTLESLSHLKLYYAAFRQMKSKQAAKAQQIQPLEDVKPRHPQYGITQAYYDQHLLTYQNDMDYYYFRLRYIRLQQELLNTLLKELENGKGIIALISKVSSSSTGTEKY